MNTKDNRIDQGALPQDKDEKPSPDKEILSAKQTAPDKEILSAKQTAPDMPNREAVQMMLRCREEITSLRRDLDALRPKAEAYDALVAVLNLMPQRGGGVMGEDMVWLLNRRIRELSPAEGRANG